MKSFVSDVAPEIIACIREARHPTVHEVSRLAARIRAEVYGAASAFSWGDNHDEHIERLVSFRVAQAALIGGVVVTADASPTIIAAQVPQIPV